MKGEMNVDDAVGIQLRWTKNLEIREIERNAMFQIGFSVALHRATRLLACNLNKWPVSLEVDHVAALNTSPLFAAERAIDGREHEVALEGNHNKIPRISNLASCLSLASPSSNYGSGTSP